VLTDGTGLAPNRQYFLATRDFVASQPALLTALLQQVAATDNWAEAHPDETVALLTPSLKLPVSVVRTAVGRLAYGVSPMTLEAVADQQRIADTFFALHLIPVPVSIREALWAPPS